MSLDPPLNGGGARERIAFAQLIGTAACYSAITVLTVVSTRMGTLLAMILSVRFVSAALAMSFVGLKPALHLPARTWWKLVLVGGIGQSIIGLMTLSALAFMPAATMVFMFYSFPAWVAVIAAVRGIDRIDRRRGVSLALALLGLIVLVGLPGQGTINPYGAVLALGAAIVYALYIPVMDHLQRGVNVYATSFAVCLGCAVLLTGYAAVRGELLFVQPAASWLAMIVLGVVCTAFTFVLFFKALPVLGPVRTAISLTVEPFFAAILAHLVLDQPITLAVLLGGSLICMAVVVLQGYPGRALKTMTTPGSV
jgi:drug/metabolite transporter (DMT)-like permease